MEFLKIFNKVSAAKIFNLSKSVDALLVVDLSSGLKLLNVQLKDEPRVNALKIGEIPVDKREENILNCLREFIQENNIQHKNAILSPRLESLLIKRIQLPAIPPAELPEAVKWQLKDEAHFDLATAALDFSVIKETAKEDGSRLLNVMCAVAPEQKIRNEVLLLKQAGLNCLAVIPLIFGYAKLVGRYFLPGQKDEAAGILHLQEDNCHFSIHKEDKLEFYRELPISVNKLREALGSALVSDKGKVELSPDEIEEVLFSVGVPQADAVYKDKLDSTQILSMLRPALERLMQEIKRSLTYYESQFQGWAVNRIMVAGLGAQVPNLDKFLSRESGLNIQKISLEDKNIASPQVKVAMPSDCYASFGLALDYAQNINLLPHEFRTEKIERFQKVSLRWVAFMAFLLLIFSYIFAKVGVSAYQKRLDNATVYLKVLSEVKQMKTSIDELNNFVTEIKNLEPPLGLMLKRLSGIAGKELFLDNFSLNCDSKMGSIAGFIKSAYQNPDALLTKFVGEMKNSLSFAETAISSVEKTADTAKFNITFKLP